MQPIIETIIVPVTDVSKMLKVLNHRLGEAEKRIKDVIDINPGNALKSKLICSSIKNGNLICDYEFMLVVGYLNDYN